MANTTQDENGTGYFAYAFYDRVRRVADDRRLGSALLGAVLAHEIGHLLLGSNSHSVTGIMSGHWEYRELMNISESVMTFVPAQSKTIQDRLRLAQPERTRENNDNAGNADSLAAFGGK